MHTTHEAIVLPLLTFAKIKYVCLKKILIQKHEGLVNIIAKHKNEHSFTYGRPAIYINLLKIYLLNNKPKTATIQQFY